MVDERIEQLAAGGLGALLAAAVVDVLEQAVLVLQFEVVPVLAAQEHPAVAVLQFEVMDALEDLREGLTALEVQVAVVGGLRQALAAVVDPDQVRISTAHSPAGTDGQRGIEASLDLSHVEGDALCLGDAAERNGDGQRFQSEFGARCCCFHAAPLLGVWWPRKLNSRNPRT
ncbi:hypothetical protein D3C76_991970 [compost metagenome]